MYIYDGSDPIDNITDITVYKDEDDRLADLESRYRYLSTERSVLAQRLGHLGGFRVNHSGINKWDRERLVTRMFVKLKAIEAEMFDLLLELYPSSYN